MAHSPERAEAGPIIANPDPDRKPKPKEVAEIKVEPQEYLGSMLELDLAKLDPNFSYRWVHKSNLKIARAKAKGYRVVKPDEEQIQNVVGDSPETEDGTFTVGDVILMKCPKSLHKARRERVKTKVERRLKGPMRKFRKDAQAKSMHFSEPIEVITDKE